jgi:DNA primase
VEEMSEKQIVKALRNKVPASQYLEMFGIKRRPSEEGKEVRATSEQKTREVSEKKKGLEEVLEDLSGTLKARILDHEGKTVKEIPVRDVVGTLRNWPKGSKEGEALVFDGIITQRILDLAEPSGIKKVVGVKMGSRVKQPASIEVLVKD